MCVSRCVHVSVRGRGRGRGYKLYIPTNVHTQEFEHTARRILNMACDTHCLVCQFLAQQGV